MSEKLLYTDDILVHTSKGEYSFEAETLTRVLEVHRDDISMNYNDINNLIERVRELEDQIEELNKLLKVSDK